MSEQRITSQDEVDAILQRRRHQRGAKSCYPCRKRKVRCDASERFPCSNCTRRDQVEICHFQPHVSGQSGIYFGHTPHQSGTISGEAPQKSKPSSSNYLYTTPEALYGRVSNETTSRPAGVGWGIASVDTHDPTPYVATTGDSTPVPPNRRRHDPDSFIGANSAASIVRRQLNSPGSERVTQDIRPVLGLENTSASYPYMKARTDIQVLDELNEVLPSSSDVVKYFHYYRTLAFAFNPIIADIDEFEVFVCEFLERAAESEHGKKRVLQIATLERDVAQISLLLATIASGIQFSELGVGERLALSREFARRSFQCLRLANYLLRPSLEGVQALLILGHVLQNDGQSDGAWSFLGTTVRLAQSLGLHTDRYYSKDLTESMRTKRRALWKNVMWQDSLLSLCYDRPPALAFYKMFTEPNAEGLLDYVHGMYEVSRIGLSVLVYSNAAGEDLDLDKLIQHVLDVERIRVGVLPHLQSKDRCFTCKQRQEYFTFMLQTSFLISLICRPAFRAPGPPAQRQQHATLVSKGKENLANATRAFLDIRLISVYAKRSWSMIHEGLSSALLLGILGETQREEVRELQQRVIDVLSNKDEARSSWLSKSHARALRALRLTLHRENPDMIPTPPMGLAASQSLESEAADSDSRYALPVYQMTSCADVGLLPGQQQNDFSALSYFDSLLWDSNVENDVDFFNDLPQQELWGL